MSFQSSSGDRVLPPIMTIKSSSPTNNSIPKPILPPVSCLAPPIPPLISPLTSPSDFTNNSNPLHTPQPYMLSPQKTEHTSPHTPLTPPTSSHFHFHSHSETPTSQQQYVDQQRSQPFSPPRAAGSAPPHIPPSSHHHSMVIRPVHHPYGHPIYHHQQARPVVDPASELLAEKRRRNAGASARFRDRRKQREREMQEKCQFLERRVQELESTDSAKRIAELEKKLEEANEERDTSSQKLQEQEKELHKLRSRLCEREIEFLTPPSSTGEYDSKDILFDDASRLSRSPSSSSISSDHRRKPTDVQSLLS